MQKGTVGAVGLELAENFFAKGNIFAELLDLCVEKCYTDKIVN